VSLVAVLVVSRAARLWGLFLLTLVFGAAGAFFGPAATAIVRDILPAELLVPASSLRSLSQPLSQFLFGPLAGRAFGIDGASFAVSAGCLAAMRNIPTVKATSSRILVGMAEGLRCCYSQRWLACSIVAVAPPTVAAAEARGFIDFAAGPEFPGQRK
jgi:hypothetical protein